MGRVLFLSHSASRNGASLLLLSTLRWLRASSDLELHVLSCGTGPLIDEYRKVATTRVLRNLMPLTRVPGFSWFEGSVGRLQRSIVESQLGRDRFDLVYANTTATLPQVAVAARQGIPVLWHIHELPYALRIAAGRKPAASPWLQVRRFIAVSRAVVDALSTQHGVAPERVDLVHGFVDAPKRADEAVATPRRRLLNELGWPEDAFVVGGCGGLGWRKGSDVFVRIAASAAHRLPSRRPFRFLWVGGEADGEGALQFAHDARLLGIESICRHVPATDDVDSFYRAMDVFALTSREDPFPLVALEAGAHGVPTICFEGAGGAIEYVADGRGVTVPYLDTDAFAAAIARLERDQPGLARMGDLSRHRVLNEHSARRQAPLILASIERCMAT